MTDGGPAFPVADLSKAQAPGMTLRDYFAAAALTGLLAEPDHRSCSSGADVETWRADVRAGDAVWCYQMADAMLAAQKEVGK